MKTWSGQDAPLDAGGRVSLIDIVVHLGRTRRFGGFGSQEWTVLHHSMLVALLWQAAGYPVEKLVYALLHDAHEAYTGDIPRPVKRRMGTAVHDLEGHIDQSIRGRVGLHMPTEADRKYIKLCDAAALLIEAHLFGPPGTSDVVRTHDIEPDDKREIERIMRAGVPELTDIINWRQRAPR